MILKNVHKDENGWSICDYNTTWNYGYDFMLDAAQTLIDTDFKENTQRLAIAAISGEPFQERMEELRANGLQIRACESIAEECGVLVISGISEIMELPMQFMLFNKSNVVKLYVPDAKVFEEYGDHVFDKYMNSVEIKAYCKDAARTAVEEFRRSGND